MIITMGLGTEAGGVTNIYYVTEEIGVDFSSSIEIAIDFDADIAIVAEED